MEILNKLKQFILDNKLCFDNDGSGLNSNCLILAGYACYIKAPVEILNILLKIYSTEVTNEFFRVYNYAKKKNYGENWNTPEYQKIYIYTIEE